MGAASGAVHKIRNAQLCFWVGIEDGGSNDDIVPLKNDRAAKNKEKMINLQKQKK